MTELEKIEYAKSFIDKLANGINPLDDPSIPEGDTVNNVRLSRCFFYVSDILRQVIDNGGVNPPPKTPKVGKQAFSLTDEARAALKVTNTTLTVSEIADYLNDTIDETTTDKISAAAINSWLVDIGFLEVVEMPNGKTRKNPTPDGAELGLITEDRVGQYGAYTIVLFGAPAQTFVYDHVDAIVEHHLTEKAAKKEKRAADKAARDAAKAERNAAKASLQAHGAAIPAPPTSQPPATDFLHRPWTETHDERLRKMAADGATVAEMADAIKRTEAGIRERLRVLGLM
jgi:hypothetical protein